MSSDKNAASVTIKMPLWVLEAVKDEAEKQNLTIQSLIMKSVITSITKK